jgi:hypothetical protein
LPSLNLRRINPLESFYGPARILIAIGAAAYYYWFWFVGWEKFLDLDCSTFAVFGTSLSTAPSAFFAGWSLSL